MHMHARVGVFLGQRFEIYSLRIFTLRSYNNQTSVTKSLTTFAHQTIPASHRPNEY